MHQLGVAFVILLVLTSARLAAAQPTPAQSFSEAHRSKALAVAKLAQPRELVLDAAMSAVAREMPVALRASADGKILEAEHPGIIDAMLRASYPELRSMLDRRLPDLWTRMAKAYSDDLSDVELDSLLQFFLSSTGEKLIRISNQQFDSGPMVEEVMKSEDFSFTLDSVQAGLRVGVTKAVSAMTPEELSQLIAFGTSDTGKKVRLVGPKIKKIVVNWGNESDPADEKRVEEVMTRTVDAYIERKQPG